MQFKHIEALLWAGTAALFILGDIVTTMVGIRVGLIELNPAGRVVMSTSGFAGIVVIKAAAMSVGIAGYAAIGESSRLRVVVPAIFTVVGATAFVVNVYLIAATV